MDDNPNSVALSDDDDLNTTAPSPRPDVWKMPEPVFQQTSGKLPAGYERNYSDDPTPATESASSSGNEKPVVDLGPENISASLPEPKPANAKLKLVLVFLGLAAMIAFIVVFLTVVYFFFWRS